MVCIQPFPVRDLRMIIIWRVAWKSFIRAFGTAGHVHLTTDISREIFRRSLRLSLAEAKSSQQ